MSQSVINKKRHNNNGFSLLECLISLIILSVGLLGLADAQLLAIRYDQNTNHLFLATHAINSLAEQLRADDSNLARQATIQYWQIHIQDVLPGASFDVTNSNNHYHCIIKWATSQQNSLVIQYASIAEDIYL